ncbi:MAG: DUF402 domain-containing protein [Chloroflexi bacterium]|nr:MAG: DUF402 domain-containing protein [Chloroflexota bacterium]
MSETHFREIKHRLDGSVVTFDCALVRRAPDHVVLRYDITGEGGEVAGLRLPGGTVTYAYYWADRPYNVYHWVLPDGTTAGYYFNLAGETEIGNDYVEWKDLTVDILITPDGDYRVLDEEELPEDVGPAIRARIAQGKAAVFRDHAWLVEVIERTSRERERSSWL